jgi:hypothetical protein
MRTVRLLVAGLVLVLAGALLALPPGPAAAATFSDVGGGHPFVADVEWVASHGIAEGFPDGTFRPASPVSRQAMAAFLHRMPGEDVGAPPTSASFGDVGSTHPFFADVEWLAAQGITGGFVDGTFRPGAPVSRQAMAAFLHRAAVRVADATLDRIDAPVVVTGSRLAPLAERSAADVVGFRVVAGAAGPEWEQVPLQVDERKVTNFGQVPGGAQVGGSTAQGTVYGTPPRTAANRDLTALQYADPSTFVGADPNPAVDADDELVFMLGDTGHRAPDALADPAGVVSGSGVQLATVDPDGGGEAWIYAFEDDDLPPLATDHVSYELELVSGPLTTTYRTGDGPNPETSRAVGATYEARYPDRWMEADWRITAGGATGVDVLDGMKFQFDLGSCGRSNQSFVSGGPDGYPGEGVIAASIDGPVRAIRSFLGANSGPYSQRTNLIYADRQDLVTDLRVHAISSTIEWPDLSTAAIGMTYRSSLEPGGVLVDGVPDPGMPTVAAPSTSVPTWEVYAGPQGTVQVAWDLDTDQPGHELQRAWVDQLDADAALGYPGCWDADDDHMIGASVVAGSALANSDPANETTPTRVHLRQTIRFGAPPGSGQDPGPGTAAWATELRDPVLVATTAR